jgi:hypothetical protein
MIKDILQRAFIYQLIAYEYLNSSKSFQRMKNFTETNIKNTNLIIRLKNRK